MCKEQPAGGGDVQANEPRPSAIVSPTIGSVPRGKGEDPAKGEAIPLNFGDYRDWASGEILRDKQRYDSYIYNDGAESRLGKQQF